MKIHRIILITSILICIGINELRAQSNPNSVYLELMGNAGLYSINYDRLIGESIGLRIGFMYFSTESSEVFEVKDLITVPIMFNYFVGDEHKLELGAGVTYAHHERANFIFISSAGGSTITGTATIGYRYQNNDGGFLFRIGFTPFFSSEGFYPSGGISFGASFD